MVGAEKESAVWKSNIEVIAFNNSNVLRDQQVTHDDVPVIVDKCIKFVYSHGIMTEGVYRKAGSNININKLLSQFRSNAWAVQISREEYRWVSGFRLSYSKYKMSVFVVNMMWQMF